MSRHKVASAVIAVPLAGVVALFGAAASGSGNAGAPVAVADAGAASMRPSEPAAPPSTIDTAAQEAAARAAKEKAAQGAAAKEKADSEAAAQAKAAKAKAAKIKAAKAKAAKIKAAKAKAAKQKAAREKAAREAAARRKAASDCTPGYSPCLPPASDYDCSGGSGNGPRYADGPVEVTGDDPYDLDRDGDGTGCDD